MSESKPTPDDEWLTRKSPEQWIQHALVELERAQAAFHARDAGAAIAHVKRAGGMALNGALIVRRDERWGRKYVEHLRALGESEDAPAEVREAARRLCAARAPAGPVVALRTRSDEERLLEAARTVMAHAYAIVHGSLGKRASRSDSERES
jgi:HEPN domain-containing protein